MASHSCVIPAMDCPAEEAVIRRRVGARAGVTSPSLGLLNRRLTAVHMLASDGPMVEALTDCGDGTGARNGGR